MATKSDSLSSKLYDNYSSFLSVKDCIDLSSDIMEIVKDSPKYSLLLNSWLSGDSIEDDVIVNHFSLIELATKLNPDIPNIPVAIYILWLEEKSDELYHGLASVASQRCVANPRIVTGEPCKYAILSDKTWYFMLDNQSEEEMKEYQAWQVLLLNPRLIIQIVFDYENNTVISLQDDGSYVVSTEREQGN